MPNWVFNTLTIEGTPTSAKKLKKQMNKPFIDYITPIGDLEYNNVKEVKYSKPVFAFRNIIAPTDLKAYLEQPWDNTPERKANPDSWYNWNIRNWGVKWDVAVSNDEKYPDTELLEEGKNGENYVLVYQFNTPWGVAEEALVKLSSQYPDLLLTLDFEEETGWGGQWEILRGKIISQNEYNWRCRNCSYEELGEPPYCEDCEYDMCPKCNYGEPSLDYIKNCPTHSVLLTSTGKAE